MTVFRLATVGGEAVIEVVSAIVAPFAKAVHRLRREAEIVRAERHMEKLNDDLLRDIGVSRSQIYMAARKGRDGFSRQWL